MGFWSGDITPAKREWRWEYKRVWWPFLQCQRSHRFLFLKKAYYGRHYIDWEFRYDIWLSSEEFMIATLRDEFNERG